jgi:hypothetical protein
MIKKLSICVLTILGLASASSGLVAAESTTPAKIKASEKRIDPGSKVTLNPQPIPPGREKRTVAGSKVTLNPQPIPPGRVQAPKAKPGSP